MKNLYIIILYFFIINLTCNDLCLSSEISFNITISFQDQAYKDIKYAAFKKGNYTWLVFNKKTISNIPDLLKQYPQILKCEVTDNYTIFKFNIINRTPIIYFKNNSLIIEFSDKDTVSSLPLLPIKRNNQVFIPLRNSGNIIEITEKENKLIIVPSEYSIHNDYRFINFNLLSTYYGIVIQSKVDKLPLTRDLEGVHITNIEKSITEIANKGILEDYVIFKFSQWLLNKDDDYCSVYDKIISNIIKAKNNPRKHFFQQIKLAKFYLAHTLFHEANEYLRYIKNIHFDLMKDDIIFNEYTLLKMISLYMTDNFQQSYEEFFKLKRDRFNDIEQLELNFWYDAINIALHKKNIDIKYLEGLDTFLQYYTNPNKKKFAFISLENAIANKFTSKAERILLSLSKESLSPREKAYLKTLEIDCNILSNKGNFDDLIKQYVNIIKSSADNPESRAWAIYKMVVALYHHNNIKLSEAIEELNKVSIIWRGDKFEVLLTDFLSDLYVKNKEYDKSLIYLRNMLNYYPRYANLLYIADKMNTIFMDVFYRNKGNELSNFKKISLFYDFRELIPMGNIGIVMTLDLISYLVKFNLNDKAIPFLEHLIHYRINDPYTKSKYLMKVANLYRNEEQPDKAIKVLNDNSYIIEQYFSQDLKYLKSNILMDLNKSDEALEIINGDEGEKADSIRCDIWWKTKNWQELRKISEKKLEYRDNPLKKLSALEQKYVFKLAVVYAATLEYDNLIKLYKRFKDMLDNKEHKEIMRDLMKIAYFKNITNIENYYDKVVDIYSKINNDIIDHDINE